MSQHELYDRVFDLARRIGDGPIREAAHLTINTPELAAPAAYVLLGTGLGPAVWQLSEVVMSTQAALARSLTSDAFTVTDDAREPGESVGQASAALTEASDHLRAAHDALMVAQAAISQQGWTAL